MKYFGLNEVIILQKPIDSYDIGFEVLRFDWSYYFSAVNCEFSYLFMTLVA
jgi:hypothetical protein